MHLMDVYPHLRIEREQPEKNRRPGRPPIIQPPSDIPGHARKLKQSLSLATEESKQDVGGFDDRLLFKLKIGSLSPDEIEKGFAGIELISQEYGGYALVFATVEALGEFEARLNELADGRNPKYLNILYALEAFERFTPDDRKGWALKRDGFPAAKLFIIDVELWPLRKGNEREQMIFDFNSWLAGSKAEILDKVNVDDYVAYRLKLSRETAEDILNNRDVRNADLPPRLRLEPGVLQLDIMGVQQLPPPDNAPLIAVLDSGIAGNHPLLAPALADAQGFVGPEKIAYDDHGHGTGVAGIALYGDVEHSAQSKTFIPQLRLLSGRVLDHNAEMDSRFIENIVEEAVRYFHDSYKCKVYNLSYGDLNKPYLGGRVRGLAYTLDRLSRELDILFVVPTGNNDNVPSCELNMEHDHLFHDENRLIDPAPALNALTVGSLARWDNSSQAQRHPNHIEEIPIAQRDQPSPFSRCGYSVKNAIKPELVAYGGNMALNPRIQNSRPSKSTLGELSTSKDFAAGKLMTEMSGTSFAAPHVSHHAARLLAELPSATMNLIRALLLVNARLPEASRTLFGGDAERLSQSVGYGMVDESTLYRSIEEQVILIAESGLIDKNQHFYEVPIPDSFYGGKTRRKREITVALAHCPPVRTTRVDYKATRFQFRLVEEKSLNEAVAAFDKEQAEDVESIKELSCNKRTYGAKKRGAGTVQASTWEIKQSRTDKLFLIVTRIDSPWGKVMTLAEEPYALAVRMSDRENESARLYSEIKVQLQIKARIRI